MHIWSPEKRQTYVLEHVVSPKLSNELNLKNLLFMRKKSLNHFYDCTSLAHRPLFTIHLQSYLFYNAALLLFSTSTQSRMPREGNSERDLWQRPSLLSDILATQHKALMRLQSVKGYLSFLLSPPTCLNSSILCSCQLNSENCVQTTLRFWHKVSNAATKQGKAKNWYFITFHPPQLWKSWL